MCLESTNIFGVKISTGIIFVAPLFVLIYSTKFIYRDRIVVICI